MTQASGGTARHYAQAAFEVARARHDVPGWQADLNRMEAIFSDEDVRLALENP